MSIQDIKQSDCYISDFAAIVKWFQEFDKALHYPNCEGYEDRKRMVKQAEQEFIKKFLTHS